MCCEKKKKNPFCGYHLGMGITGVCSQCMVYHLELLFDQSFAVSGLLQQVYAIEMFVRFFILFVILLLPSERERKKACPTKGQIITISFRE